MSIHSNLISSEIHITRGLIIILPSYPCMYLPNRELGVPGPVRGFSKWRDEILEDVIRGRRLLSDKQRSSNKKVTLFKQNLKLQLEYISWSYRSWLLLCADGATTNLINKKNGHKNSFINHSENFHTTCYPLKAPERFIAHIREHSKNTDIFLSDYLEKGPWGDMNNNKTSKILKWRSSHMN